MTISGKYATNAPNGYLYIQKSSDNWATHEYVNESKRGILVKSDIRTITFTPEDNMSYRIRALNLAPEMIPGILESIQIEIGDSATEYESYIQPITSISDENGVIKGLSSSNPTTILVANGEDVIINASYYTNVLDNHINNKLLALENKLKDYINETIANGEW